MANTLSAEEFLRNLIESSLLSLDEVNSVLGVLPAVPDTDGETVARRLIEAGKLTAFQASAVREQRGDELVIGNYQILDRLGAGGMGTVYKARHRRMKRVVAIKVLSRAVGADVRFVQRFQREVEAVARLTHPNIVMAYDADEAESGHYLVMEFVDGRDLASEVQKGGPLSVAEAAACVLQAARALDYAHGQGIIHRDIKPANLLRDASGVVKVADLGLARFSEQLDRPVEEASALTQAGAIMGTVDYMSPEQAMGLTTIDARTDIYSLGCTLHYLLLGRAPFRGPTMMAILVQHRESPPPSLRDARAEIPTGLDEVFRRMVAKKPEERYASMAEVVRALEALALGQPTAPRPHADAPATAAPAPDTARATTPAAIDQTVDLPPPRPNPTRTPTLLLVEPSRAQSVIIRKHLQELGFRDVPAVVSGEQALIKARDARPQVVLAAMHLPDMTGVQLAQRMREENALAQVAFILITSRAEAHHEQTLRGGEAILLAKPFDVPQLSQALTAAGAFLMRPSAAAPDLTLLKVLIADDSAAARHHIRAVLSGLGLRQFTEAADGAEAVALAGKDRYDLVVTDYNMPGLDGRGLIDFLRHRSATPAVPVVMVTTETDPAKLDAVRKLGVTGICDKSFRSEIVREMLSCLN